MFGPCGECPGIFNTTMSGHETSICLTELKAFRDWLGAFHFDNARYPLANLASSTRLALSCTLAFLCSFVTVSSALLAYLLLSLVYVEASFRLKDSGKSVRSRAAIVQHVQTFSDVVHMRSPCAVVNFVKR